MTELKTKILDSVKKNNITMTPRWKFVLYSSLGIAGILFVFLLAVFVFSLILFILSRYGFMYMPLFGFMATLHALKAVPLLLFMCTVVLLILVEVSARYYSFSFKRPLAVTLLIITSCALVAGFIISETSIHEHIRDYVREHRLEMMERVYERPAPLRKMNGLDVLRGEVVATTSTAATVRLFDGATIVVYATTSKTIFSMPSVGDDIVLLGNFIGDRFEVVGMRPAPRTPFRSYGKERPDPMREHDRPSVRRFDDVPMMVK